MSRREFQLIEGRSRKFWAIELDGNRHTIAFGRIGTAGQTQTKEFASEEAARQSCEKLIAEKQKKGYQEVQTGASPAAPQATVTASDPTARETAPPVEDTPAPPTRVNTAVTHTVELDPRDWFWATWRKLKPLQRPEPQPFDLDACCERIVRGEVGQNIPNLRGLPPSLSREEAHFWFEVQRADWRPVSKSDYRQGRERLAARLRKLPFTGNVPYDDLKKELESYSLVHTLMPLLAVLLPAAAIVELMLDLKGRPLSHPANEYSIPRAASSFREGVLPYLSEKEVNVLRQRVRKALAAAQQPVQDYEPFSIEFYLAALLGCHEEMRQVVCGWPSDRYSGKSHTVTTQEPQLLIFGLGDPRLVEAEMRRLHLTLGHYWRDDYIRAWLAHTEGSALDLVTAAIVPEKNRDGCAKMIATLALVKAPEAAEHMLLLSRSSKAPKAARPWLEEEVGNAIAGLIPTAAGRGQLAEAALEYLRAKDRQGFGPLIEECLHKEPAEVAARIRSTVLEHKEKVYTPLDDASTPGWLKEGLKHSERLTPLKGAEWVHADKLPPLTLGDRRLTPEQVRAVRLALQNSDLANPHPLLAGLKKHADRESLDAFAWALFEQWLAEGGPPKQKWAMLAIGFLSGDACALKLTPLVRQWPGESQHARAALGLECLRAIGTDTALMQLNGIAQKLKFQGLKSKALQFMEAIAQDRGMSRADLEDRIVPDCDLDERGRRVFDFGPRRFHFVLGPGLKPMVKDESGAVKPDLPRPGVKDDASLAGQAVKDWKLLKKQVAEVAKVQAVRLEQALVTGRRWPVGSFEALLVRHPLLTNLVRLLLWGGYDAGGKLVLTFRVTEDQAYADVKDEPCTLRGVESVGVVHPLHLSDDLRRAWGGVFGDYEIIPPFPQLGRATYHLEKEERKAQGITRFDKVKIPAATLVFGLEKLGWVRGAPQDNGWVNVHSRPFPGSDVTAVVAYKPGFPVGYREGWEDQQITECLFLPGVRPVSADGFWLRREGNLLTLGKVDAVAVSEVLHDLTTVAAKGK
jgi:predicted DNA-binding WGR domain protein